ncbi:hypothetical protein CLOSBL3_20559 [Clostridiaceae bacterium BL-3]|nr:hypothetical protein CLOSBL3_20559 [Clostridiaceae bacterium BL-3]
MDCFTEGIVFQFLIGNLKTAIARGVEEGFKKFQFLIGNLKTKK